MWCSHLHFFSSTLLFTRLVRSPDLHSASAKASRFNRANCEMSSTSAVKEPVSGTQASFSSEDAATQKAQKEFTNARLLRTFQRIHFENEPKGQYYIGIVREIGKETFRALLVVVETAEVLISEGKQTSHLSSTPSCIAPY